MLHRRQKGKVTIISNFISILPKIWNVRKQHNLDIIQPLSKMFQDCVFKSTSRKTLLVIEQNLREPRYKSVSKLY
jgi:hypothetical protein